MEERRREEARRIAEEEEAERRREDERQAEIRRINIERQKVIDARMAEVRRQQAMLADQQALREGQDADECTICQMEFTDEEGQQKVKPCSTCNNVVHKSCLEDYHRRVANHQVTGGRMRCSDGSIHAKCFTCTKKLFTFNEAQEFAQRCHPAVESTADL